MRKIISALGAALFVTACASGAQMQAECEARFQQFTDIYNCTASEIAKRNPSILSNARAKLYMLRGEQLSKQVEAGTMSSLDAKVAWQQLFVELKAQRDSDVVRALATFPVRTPSPTTTCTSQRYGNTVTTNCQ